MREAIEDEKRTRIFKAEIGRRNPDLHHLNTTQTSPKKGWRRFNSVAGHHLNLNSLLDFVVATLLLLKMPLNITARPKRCGEF
jgi:hypothetical protein